MPSPAARAGQLLDPAGRHQDDRAVESVVADHEVRAAAEQQPAGGIRPGLPRGVDQAGRLGCPDQVRRGAAHPDAREAGRTCRARLSCTLTVTRALPKTVAPPATTVRSIRAVSASTAPDRGGDGDGGAVGGVDGHRAGEAHLVVHDLGRVADPVDDRLDRDAHGEHAVGEHAGQPDALRDVVAVVDGVEVAGCAGVLDEGVAAEQVGLLGDDLADGRPAGSFVAPDHEGGDRGDDVRAAASTMSDSAVTMEWPPSDFTLVTVKVAVSSSPATIGRL